METPRQASGTQNLCLGRDSGASLEDRLLPPCVTAAHTRQRHGLGLQKKTAPPSPFNFNQIAESAWGRVSIFPVF